MVVLAAWALVGCRNARVPESFNEAGKAPAIYPDYSDVTVPVNIAPLTFEWDGGCDEIVARLKAGDQVLIELDNGVVIEKGRTPTSSFAKTGTWEKRDKCSLSAFNKFVAESYSVPESAIKAMSGVKYFSGMKGADIGKLIFSILPMNMSVEDTKKLIDFLIVLSNEESAIVDSIFAGMSAIGENELKAAYQAVYDKRRLLNREIKELAALAGTPCEEIKETESELHNSLMQLGGREEMARSYAERLRAYENLVRTRNQMLGMKANVIQKLDALKNVQAPDAAKEISVQQELVKYRDEYLPKLNSAIAAIEAALPNNKAQVDAMKAHTCPINPGIICTTDMSGNISRGEAVLAEAEGKLSKYKADISHLRQLIANRQTTLEEIANQKFAWQQKVTLQEQLQAIVIPEEPVAPAKVEVGNLPAEKAEIQRKLNAIALRGKVLQAQKSLEGKKEELMRYERLLTALDPKGGIRNIQLKKILAPIQAKCQEKADRFRPGFKIEFRCEDEFNVMIETHPGTGFRPIETASTGEFLFVSYMLMSVISMVTNPKFMLLDGLDALDAKTLKGFIELLNEDTAVENIFITAVNHPDTLDVINSIPGVAVVEMK